MRVIRIFDGADGEARFEDIELDLILDDLAPPAPPLEQSAHLAARETFLLRFPPGWTGPRHPAPARQLMAFTTGRLEVDAGGEVRTIRAGDVVLLEDTAGSGHRTTAMEETVALVVRL